MPVATTVLKVQKVIIKNAPTILAVAGAIGAIAYKRYWDKKHRFIPASELKTL